MLTSWLGRWGKYNRTRGNFLKSASLLFGLITSILSLLVFGKNGGIGFWAFLIAACFVGGYVWGIVMWSLHFSHVYQHYENK